jgi:hypothetical protein
MMIMHVLLIELLCQGITGWNLALECLFVRCVWVVRSIVDRQVVKSFLSMTIVMGERTGLDHS